MKEKRNKFGAQRTRGYASKLEADVADWLAASLDDGEELLEQIPITFACGAKYVCDFAVARDGRIVRYVEAKGAETSVWKLKMRLLKHEMPDIASITYVVKRGRRGTLEQRRLTEKQRRKRR